MQPDLLPAEKEEHEPEPMQRTEAPEFESLANVEAPTIVSTPMVPKKKSKINLAGLALGVCVFLLLGTLTWIGYWAYRLSTELATTQQEFAALQAEHDQLKTDYATLTGERDKLNADLTQTRADLDKATTDLAATKTDLQAAQDQNQTLSAKTAKTKKLTEILYAWTEISGPIDLLGIDKMIRDTKDQELIKHWTNLKKSPSEVGFDTFFKYLMSALRDSTQ